MLAWCDELRTLGVRANADTPEDATRAREFGAEGIGLCRTEHMFMAADRQPKMRAMIMAEGEEARRAALAELLPLQQEDFEGLFEAMEGEPVTIRLLDPPLHEFLPHRFELERQLEHARDTGGETDELERTLERVQALEETNPMLGTRGCRLGILYPEIYEMQAVAIAQAAIAVRERTGKAPLLEIMIPLVDYEEELELMRELVVKAGHERGLEVGRDFLVGTMIELPRACFLADRDRPPRRLLLLRHERPHADGPRLLARRRRGQVPRHVPGAQDRRPLAVRDDRRARRRPARPDRRLAGPQDEAEHLKLGICGEHGGDPDSIDFFHHVRLDYVSCSPFRVPIARVAAAQAAVR